MFLTGGTDVADQFVCRARQDDDDNCDAHDEDEANSNTTARARMNGSVGQSIIKKRMILSPMSQKLP